jgi:cobalt-zinc-cadmium efflux system outer membrane protein
MPQFEETPTWAHSSKQANPMMKRRTTRYERQARSLLNRICRTITAIAMAQQAGLAQTALSWQQIKERFEAANPTLKAAQLNVDESRAAETTAYLRPNPALTGTLDQFTPLSTVPSSTPGNSVYRPFSSVLPYGALSYLHERQHKRELRLEGAKQATGIAGSIFADQERSLLFSLRGAFVQTLQAKAVRQNAKSNLEYWDRVLAVSRKRFEAGDLAEADIERLELQRIQFESDFETAIVNLRTAKIQLLTLLNDRTPLEQFDVDGPYEFSESLIPLDEFHTVALAARPDLKAAIQSVELAKTSHQLAIANGSTDPTFSFDLARNPPIPVYFGFSVSIPLRIFDRNQGEKERKRIDIGRNERLLDATQAQLFSDVDSAYVTLVSTVNLLRPYRDKYLKLAESSRKRMAFSYENGGASLLDYLDAEKAYRDTRVAYLNLIGTYLTVAAQMNMAVGREVIQ